MFSIGEMIVHPMHGAGFVDDITTVEVNGEVKKYYVLRISVGNMIVRVPVDNSQDIGVRPVMCAEDVRKVLEQIPQITVECNNNWNQRYRENMDRIKSGDLLKVAEVVKVLYQRDLQRGISTGERKMLHTAKQILVSEMILSMDDTYEHCSQMLEQALKGPKN